MSARLNTPLPPLLHIVLSNLPEQVQQQLAVWALPPQPADRRRPQLGAAALRLQLHDADCRLPLRLHREAELLPRPRPE